MGKKYSNNLFSVKRDQVRELLKKRLGSEQNCNRISNTTEKDYIRRLKTGYNKTWNNKSFYEQFENGQGHELDGKFWSPASSSRFAFEMFSWLAELDKITKIEFEVLLPQINNANGRVNKIIKVPDMDVVFSTKDDLYFIESKYLEVYSYDEKPSDSYYKNNKGPNSLLNRYHGSKAISEQLPQMIEKIYKYISDNNLKNINDWFYPKQEITHLVGIALYLNDNPEIVSSVKAATMNLHFYNVVYQMNDSINPEIEKFRAYFQEAAKNAFMCMFGIDLDYSTKYSQEFLFELFELSPEKSLTKAFASDDTVLNQLSQFEIKIIN